MTDYLIRENRAVESVSPALPALLAWIEADPEREMTPDVQAAWAAAWQACEQHHGIEGAP